MANLFVKSWNGEASLAKAFWLVYFIFGIIVTILVTLPFYFMVPDFTYNVYQNIIMSIVFPYTLFSAICVWRCGKNSSLIWNILSKIIVVLGVLGGIFSLLHVTHTM